VATFGKAGNLWENPKENGGLQADARPQNAKGCQVLETGNLYPDGLAKCGLDPNRPGPTDVLSKEQYRRYQVVYQAHGGEPMDKHKAAWRAAILGDDGQ